MTKTQYLSKIWLVLTSKIQFKNDLFQIEKITDNKRLLKDSEDLSFTFGDKNLESISSLYKEPMIENKMEFKDENQKIIDEEKKEENAVIPLSDSMIAKNIKRTESDDSKKSKEKTLTIRTDNLTKNSLISERLNSDVTVKFVFNYQIK